MEPQLSSLIVSLEEKGPIDECLRRLVEDTGATHAMLLDKSGQVIATYGQVERQDITALGALLAGTFASSREVARLLRERDFRVLFQQGVRENIFTALVEEQWMLSIVFDKGTHIGLVKVLTKKATEELESILERVRQEGKLRDEVISTSFRTSMEDTIDLLFRD
jgi:predicted regulator of Ras-like GTPase activity (Roadblock/LC7/MglB family)